MANLALPEKRISKTGDVKLIIIDPITTAR